MDFCAGCVSNDPRELPPTPATQVLVYRLIDGPQVTGTCLHTQLKSVSGSIGKDSPHSDRGSSFRPLAVLILDLHLPS